ncbi:MAG: hypothetical protein R6U98_14600 [Pirellulaceae bacterium]
MSALTVGLGTGLGLYTWCCEPHWVELAERRLHVANLPDELSGARLAQLSDLHIGPQVDDSYLIRVFEHVKKRGPEIVVYTGDFTTYEPDGFDHVRSMVHHLPLGARGTFGVLGNHDYGPGWAHPEIADGISALASDAGVRMLRNEMTDVDGFQIVGLDDLWAGRFRPQEPMAALDPNRASIVLTHNPDTVDQPGWKDYSGWILAGHTHGGQCKPPFLPPPRLPVQNRRYTSGAFDLSDGRRLYINRGIGHLLRVRFNARPEVTIFRLERAEEP